MSRGWKIHMEVTLFGSQILDIKASFPCWFMPCLRGSFFISSSWDQAPYLKNWGIHGSVMKGSKNWALEHLTLGVDWIPLQKFKGKKKDWNWFKNMSCSMTQHYIHAPCSVIVYLNSSLSEQHLRAAKWTAALAGSTLHCPVGQLKLCQANVWFNLFVRLLKPVEIIQDPGSTADLQRKSPKLFPCERLADGPFPVADVFGTAWRVTGSSPVRGRKGWQAAEVTQMLSARKMTGHQDPPVTYVTG